MKYLIFDCSDEWNALTGVVEWTDETAKQIWELMRLAAENEAGATSVAAKFRFDVYEGSPSVLPVDLAEELDDGDRFIIIDDFDPGDREPLRWAYSEVKAYDDSYISFEFLAKHWDQAVHSQAYISLKLAEIRQLFSSVI